MNVRAFVVVLFVLDLGFVVSAYGNTPTSVSSVSNVAVWPVLNYPTSWGPVGRLGERDTDLPATQIMSNTMTAYFTNSTHACIFG